MPAPQQPNKPLPVCAGKLETDTNEGHGKRQISAVSQAAEVAFLLHHVNTKASSVVCDAELPFLLHHGNKTIDKLVFFFFFFAGWYSVLDVALNPAVLQDSKKDKTEIYMLVLNFAQQQHGIRISQQYTVVSCSPKSSPEDLQRRLGFQQWPNTSKQPDTGRAISLTSRQASTSLLCLSYCRSIIFHLLPQLLIILSVPFFCSQSEPS